MECRGHGQQALTLDAFGGGRGGEGGGAAAGGLYPEGLFMGDLLKGPLEVMEDNGLEGGGFLKEAGLEGMLPGCVQSM